MGVEECLVVLWEKGVNSGKLIVNEFVVVILINVVKIFNMYLVKGVIVLGLDVDIVVWDFNGKKIIFVLMYMFKIENNIFEGMEVIGVFIFIICNGVVVWKEGELLVKEGDG